MNEAVKAALENALYSAEESLEYNKKGLLSARQRVTKIEELVDLYQKEVEAFKEALNG